jgi:hypothetical protein
VSSGEVTFYTSAARTATPAQGTVSCGYSSGIVVVIDVTAVGVTPSVTPSIECQDVLSGKWYTLLTGAAITAVGTVVLRAFPGAAVLANLTANDALTERVRLTMTHGNATTITYSASGHLFNL